MISLRSLRLCVLCVLFHATSAHGADESITVEKKPPTTRFVEFDPAHPPADLTKLTHGEEALTRMLFNCTVHVKYNVEERRYRDGKWRASVRIGRVDVKLDLVNTIYLPHKANDRLRAHEMGHARINGIVYERAEEAARDAAQRGVQRLWHGEGPDIDAAGKAASDAAYQWICHEYLKRTDQKAFRTGEIYDELTEHGTNAKNVTEAIKEALAKQEQEARTNAKPGDGTREI
jgi:hypothetical protein